MALSVVQPLPAVQQCPCSTCRHHGKAISREYTTRIFVGDGLSPEELEAKVTAQWHYYAPHFLRAYSSLPARAVQACFGATDTNALRLLRAWNDRTDDYEDDDTNIAVLSGPPGTGKTLAAVWIALHRLAQEPPTFITGPQLARAPRYGEERDDLLAAPALILDDIGAEKTNEHFVADLDELVDAFYQRYNATLVITTNCTAQQFRKRYGARVDDRLAQCGTWIPCVGASLRRRTKESE